MSGEYFLHELNGRGKLWGMSRRKGFSTQADSDTSLVVILSVGADLRLIAPPLDGAISAHEPVVAYLAPTSSSVPVVDSRNIIVTRDVAVGTVKND